MTLALNFTKSYLNMKSVKSKLPGVSAHKYLFSVLIESFPPVCRPIRAFDLLLSLMWSWSRRWLKMKELLTFCWQPVSSFITVQNPQPRPQGSKEDVFLWSSRIIGRRLPVRTCGQESIRDISTDMTSLSGGRDQGGAAAAVRCHMFWHRWHTCNILILGGGGSRLKTGRLKALIK